MTPRLLRTSPYWPVLTHPTLRRILPGLSVSALGDGMAVVAVSWLALQLAPPANRGLWVALAVAAYTLPSVAGTFLFARVLSGVDGARLAGWDATLRALALGAIPLAYAWGVLHLALYVALLAASSLLHSWGSAGRYTLVAEALPARHHLAGNAVMSAIIEASAIAGPPLAGLLIAGAGAVWVIALDALSFAVLAVTYRLASIARSAASSSQSGGVAASSSRSGGVAASSSRSGGGGRRTAGFRVIRREPALLGLITLTFWFFFLFGPFYTAMPIYVLEDLHAPATLLGAFYTAFGAGALAGAILTGYLRRLPVTALTVAIVIGFGLTLLPLGLGAPAPLALAAFVMGGAIWAPYMPTSMALYQRHTTPADRAQVLAANGAVTVVAVPLGTMVGGPLVAFYGARHTLLLCGLAITLLGLIAATLVLTAHHRSPAVPDDRP